MSYEKREQDLDAREVEYLQTIHSIDLMAIHQAGYFQAKLYHLHKAMQDLMISVRLYYSSKELLFYDKEDGSRTCITEGQDVYEKAFEHAQSMGAQFLQELILKTPREKLGQIKHENISVPNHILYKLQYHPDPFRVLERLYIRKSVEEGSMNLTHYVERVKETQEVLVGMRMMLKIRK